MKRIGLLAVVLAVLLSGTAARADFYVIAGGGAPGTKITSVPYTITQPGFYYLGGNLTYTGSDSAITINADNVTLDLMGFSLTNSGAPGSFNYGIYMNGRTNVEIRNGTVRGFWVGVYEENNTSGNKHRAINVRAITNLYGIAFNGINHLIKNCNCSNNTRYGISLNSGVITDCVASNNLEVGIVLSGPGTVLGNAVFNNSDYNFYLGNGVATAIMVDRNSAFGLGTNYYVIPGTTGVQWGINAGSP